MIFHEGKDSAFPIEEREEYLRGITSRRALSGKPHVILSTCDRVEIYYGEGEVSPDTVEHLYRVVSGLESPLLGETAIQGQVKAAYEKARAGNILSSGLHKLFQNALKVGKRVRRETAVSRGAMSHDLAAVETLKHENVDLRESGIVVFGANRLSEAIIKRLVKEGASPAIISTRSFAKARAMAQGLGCEEFTFARAYEKILEADVVISASGAPHLIIKKDRFRHKGKIIIIDLAVPRDVEPSIGRMEGVSLYNTRDIENMIEGNHRGRAEEKDKALSIIKQEVERYQAEGRCVCA